MRTENANSILSKIRNWAPRSKPPTYFQKTEQQQAEHVTHRPRPQAHLRIRRKRVDQITSVDVPEILLLIGDGKHTTPKRPRQRVRTVMESSSALGYPMDNLAGEAGSKVLSADGLPVWGGVLGELR